MEYDTEQATAQMIQHQAVFEGKAVLEIGCGTGWISSLLARGTKEYIGIDPDENAISDAKETYDTVDFRIGTGEALMFGDSLFDLVLFTLSLHHQNSAASLKEAYRVLKRNGRLLIVEPSVKGEFQQFFHLFDDETLQIQNAHQAMMDSAFTLEGQEIFDALVRFEDKTDLCQYDFGREKISPGDDNQIINKLDQLQPETAFPIILKDTLDFYLLAKAHISPPIIGETQ